MVIAHYDRARMNTVKNMLSLSILYSRIYGYKIYRIWAFIKNMKFIILLFN